MKYFLKIFLSLFCFLFSNVLFAKTYSLPSQDDSVIGALQYTSASGQATYDVAFRYNLGQNALIAANPGVIENGKMPSGTITLPTEFLLPPVTRKGLVVNLPEMRMYYYPKNSNTVMTFPIGIGKIGKTIPITNTFITRKVVNPTWIPPQDIREFNRQQGIELPYAMGPGPDNPLGPYAIYMKIPTYLIHSTIFPGSIGRRASFGCLRMNEDDIKEFFPIIEPGTPVEIIDMPTKIAWEGNTLYIESHPPLEERSKADYATLPGIVQSLQKNIPKNNLVFVNWQAVAYLAKHPDGVPHEVGVKIQ